MTPHSPNDRPPGTLIARDARTAERNASRLAGVACEAPEKVARDAAVEAEQAYRRC